MSAPFATPSAVDLLDQVISRAKSKIADPNVPVKTRIELLWAYVKASRDLATSDVLQAEFIGLAIDVGLINERGRWLPNVHDNVRRHGREEIEHVILWGLHGLNPFEKGPLQ